MGKKVENEEINRGACSRANNWTADAGNAFTELRGEGGSAKNFISLFT